MVQKMERARDTEDLEEEAETETPEGVKRVDPGMARVEVVAKGQEEGSKDET